MLHAVLGPIGYDDLATKLTKGKANMANPKAIIAAAKRALALARKNDGVLQKTEEYFQKATGSNASLAGAGGNAAIAKGAAPSAVLIRAAVHAGISPEQIFSEVLMGGEIDAGTRKMIDDMQAAFNNLNAQFDASATIRAASDGGDMANRKQLMQWAKQSFASPNAIRAAHANYRQFLAMDTEALEQAISLFYDAW